MKSLCVVLLAALATVPVLAHHSGAGFGEETKVIKGTVKQFQFLNPHSWIQVNVTDETGKVAEWSLEWGSPNELGRQGWLKTNKNDRKAHTVTFATGRRWN